MNYIGHTLRGGCQVVSRTCLLNLPVQSSAQSCCPLSLHRALLRITSSEGRCDAVRPLTFATTPSCRQLLDDLKQLRNAPLPALCLGLAGLVPFAAPPYLMVQSGCTYAWLLYAQTAYGACILSFLGGVRWGAAMPAGSPLAADWAGLGVSVAPSLLAWGAMLVAPSWTPLAALLVAAGISACACADATLLGYPAWFRGLRLCLSVGAVLSLVVSLICIVALQQKPNYGRKTDPE